MAQTYYRDNRTSGLLLALIAILLLTALAFGIAFFMNDRREPTVAPGAGQAEMEFNTPEAPEIEPVIP